MVAGLTGGIGAGKSLVAQIFTHLGIPVYYADDAAKEIINTDEQIRQELTEVFGEEAFTAEGVYSKSYIARRVFSDAAMLDKLNKITHPPVFKHFDEWRAVNEKLGSYVVKEAALLFESGSYKKCDKSILVTAPTEVRIKRVAARDGLDRAAILARIAKQMPDAEKEQMADFIIINDESHSLIGQVMTLHAKLLQLARR